MDYGDLEEIVPLSLQEKAASPAADPVSLEAHKPVSTSAPIPDSSVTAGLSKSEALKSPQSRLDSAGPSKSSAEASSKPAIASPSAVLTPASQAAASKPAHPPTPSADPAPASEPDPKPASKQESKKTKRKKASSAKPTEGDPPTTESDLPTTAEAAPIWGPIPKKKRSQLTKSEIPASDSASVDSGKPTLPANTVPASADLVPALTPEQIQIRNLQEQIAQLTRKS